MFYSIFFWVWFVGYILAAGIMIVSDCEFKEDTWWQITCDIVMSLVVGYASWAAVGFAVYSILTEDGTRS